jgi:sortase A
VSVRAILRGTGKILITAGVLVLLFVAYELWGTNIIASNHQSELRQQFNRELHSHSVATTPTTTSTTAPGSTTTLPTKAVQAATAPPAEGQPVGEIQIPAIGADYVVVQGTDTADLERGPGHYLGTALPGNPGNAAIAGHRTTYLRPFYNLDALKPGDPIFITTVQGRFQYTVTDTQVVSPNDTAVLNPTATPTLTLTTCNPRYSASTRMVVQAALVTPVVAAAPVKKVPPARLKAAAADLAGGQGDWTGALLWGLVVAAAALVLWLVWRWRRRRWWVPVAGVLPMLVLLFFFFGALNPLLPSGY